MPSYCRYDADMPLHHLVATALSFTISLSWFFMRHQPWAWVLQNLLSCAVCSSQPTRAASIVRERRAHSP